MTGQIQTDLCVIGGGSGGLSTAAGAVQMGADVVLLEGGKMGGDCLNYGCVPSKSLIAAARQAHVPGAGRGFGISTRSPAIDYAAVNDHVRDVIASIAPHDSVERFEGLGVRVITEYGKFLSRTSVEAGDVVVKARRFVIATGSSPVVPPIPGLNKSPYLTNETIFDLREQPQHLIVIGAGPIGLELAQAHARLGCQVTVIEGLRALGRSHPDHAGMVVEKVRSEGVVIHEGTTVERVTMNEGMIEIHTSTGEMVAGSHLLVAVGRKPNIERLDLDNACITHDRGGIRVNDSLRTSNRRVYAIGDVTGGAQFTHVAGYHAGVVVRSALFGLPAKARTDIIPSVTYTDPEIAEVGLNEDEARKQYGDRLEIATAEFAENDRARAERRTDGDLRLLVVKGRPVGASMVGEHAGELIQIWALAIAANMKLSTVSGMIAPYPTLGEINKRAVGAYFSKRLFESNMVKRIVRIVQKLP